MIATGTVKNAIVIGSETMSRVLDWTDRSTCILFGDGAGAVILEGKDTPGGILASQLRSDGSGGNLLQLPVVSQNPMPMLSEDTLNGHHTSNTVTMNGRQVFRFATKVISQSIQDVLDKANLTIDDIALIIPHQANVRIIESAAKKLGVSPDKFFLNLDKMGNTSAASIPIALYEASRQELLQPNDKIIFIGFGGGLTWASTVVEWQADTTNQFYGRRGTRRLRYFASRVRSKTRQYRRQLIDVFSRSPIPEARLKDADKSKAKK